MKNELESYLNRGGNFQPNFGWSPVNIEEKDWKINLYNIVFNKKDQAVEQGLKVMQKQKQLVD